MKKLLYFLYVVKTTEVNKYKALLKATEPYSDFTAWKIFKDIIHCFIKYDTHPYDYFFFQFYLKTEQERESYLSTWDMYKLQKELNASDYRKIFKDKIKFRNVFTDFVYADGFDLLTDVDFDTELKNLKSDKFLSKDPFGVVGKGISIYEYSKIDDIGALRTELINKGETLIEGFINQHPDLQAMNGSCVNTVRIMTVVNNGTVEILDSLLRIGRGGFVDNFDAGGISAPINSNTGVVKASGVTKIPGQFFSHHPSSGVQIEGFQIPHWDLVLELVKSAALVVPEVRTVGWDIAITSDNAYLIEGNDNWDKTLWQATFRKGMKSKLDRVVDEGAVNA
ncbi:sugar-transfer associated ATP-grasp domain-containing protein [Vibrio breoganii]|uniref:sugar-transfer associated ATP-grasp domain-containing protein n=1 Tax=Vibrio breoganii TaxID=553239 RepID=UPI000C864CFB|nr:sugar-transfer associated ATP-grasp domain-containing protein [Vibrio breoganii]PMG94231.1 hypothetical protein BCU79_12125 [Vibrio breoganii]PMI16106.1 hypothetical protein BCU49_02055 [Vibrio breoganii]TKF86908.1 hypothetical protein FCV82_12085 [Vibrio breoganii]